jgi:hypothetical protein
LSESADYTYLTLPPGEAMRSCIGLVVAGMAARGKIGVGGLEEAVELLESRHSNGATTRYRFSLVEDRLLAEVEEQRKTAEVPGGKTDDEGFGWRTVVELVS